MKLSVDRLTQLRSLPQGEPAPKPIDYQHYLTTTLRSNTVTNPQHCKIILLVFVVDGVHRRYDRYFPFLYEVNQPRTVPALHLIHTAVLSCVILRHQ